MGERHKSLFSLCSANGELNIYDITRLSGLPKFRGAIWRMEWGTTSRVSHYKLLERQKKVRHGRANGAGCAND